MHVSVVSSASCVFHAGTVPLIWSRALQHEGGEAWADAETGMAEPAEAAQQELQTDLAACDSLGATELDQSVGATDILDLDLARGVIQDCSVIVGIHPDQVSRWSTCMDT